MTNILAFFAHPDDETMLAGGTLALLAKQGANVHYLSATRGEGGETGEPPVCSEAELGIVRERELTCAVQMLNGRGLSFMDYVDPRVGLGDELYPYTDNINGLVKRLLGYLDALSIDVIISHGVNGEYGHPAHLLTYRATEIAVEALDGSGPEFYSVAADFPNHPRPRLANKDQSAHLVLNIEPVLDEKTRAAMCHRSQHALFVRRSSREAGRQLSVPEVIMRLESLHQVIKGPGTPGGIVFDLLAPWIVKTDA